MKKFISILISTAFAISVFAQKQTVVDPNAQMRSLSETFNKIRVSNGIDLYLSQSSNPSIAVSASEDKYRERIKTVVENNVLRIYYDEDLSWRNNDNRKLKAYVSFKDLEELQASGASDVIVAGSINAGVFKLIMSGSSDFKGDIKATSLSIHLSGSSDVDLTGKATTLNIESSGASDISGFGFNADVVNASASGASDIEITVNERIEASASGSSNIRYKGNGTLKQNNSGNKGIKKA